MEHHLFNMLWSLPLEGKAYPPFPVNPIMVQSSVKLAKLLNLNFPSTPSL